MLLIQEQDAHSLYTETQNTVPYAQGKAIYHHTPIQKKGEIQILKALPIFNCICESSHHPKWRFSSQ